MLYNMMIVFATVFQPCPWLMCVRFYRSAYRLRPGSLSSDDLGVNKSGLLFLYFHAVFISRKFEKVRATRRKPFTVNHRSYVQTSCGVSTAGTIDFS